jgi:pilus assembly protein Flp/PilA
MLQKIKGLFIEEEGQALTEYGLIIGLIAVACIVAITAVGTEIGALLNDVVKGLQKVITPA